MASTKTRYIVKLAFTPLVIFLSILYIIFLFSPYNYFKGNKLTNAISGVFPVCLVILLPIDLVLKVFLAQNLKRLWMTEIFVLVLAAVIALLVIT